MNYQHYIRSPKWRQISRRCRKLSGDRCSFTWGLLRASDAHHLTYRHLGKETLLIDVVPVSRFIHRSVIDGPLKGVFRQFPIRFVLNWWMRCGYAVLMVVNCFRRIK